MGWFSKKQEDETARLLSEDESKEVLSSIFMDTEKRKQFRAALGKPDDGKEYCSSCGIVHLPHEHRK